MKTRLTVTALATSSLLHGAPAWGASGVDAGAWLDRVQAAGRLPRTALGQRDHPHKVRATALLAGGGALLSQEGSSPLLNLAMHGGAYRLQLDRTTGLTRSLLSAAEAKPGAGQGHAAVACGDGSTADTGKSPAQSAALLPAPRLHSPGDLLDAFPARFTWDALANARQYRVELFEGESTGRLVERLSTAAPQSHWAHLPNGSYTLRVCGVNAWGVAGMSAIARFHVRAWPAPPLLNAPLDKAVLVTERVGFRWAIPQAADFLRFQVAKDPGFERIALQVKNLTARSSGIRLRLQPGNYYWRIAAGSKANGLGPFGPAQAFALKPPEATALAQTPAPILRWRARTEGERYRVLVAREDSFAEPLIDATQAAPEVELPASSGPVFVQIKRMDPDGFPGEPEAPQYFYPAHN